MMRKLLTLLVLVCALVNTVNAATVYLTQTDPSGVHSYDTAGNWDNALAPSSENDYIVNNGYQLRTLYNGSGSVFGGNSLTLSGSAKILFSAATSLTYTINNLTIDNATFGAGSARQYHIDGDITIQSGGLIANVATTSDDRGLLFDADITGIGGFTVAIGASGYTKDVYINGQATYTGSTTVGQYATLGVYGSILIDVNDGSNSDISGLGSLTMDGKLRFDVAGVTSDGSWNVIDVDNLIETYGDNFGVALAGGTDLNFTETAPGVWTLANGGSSWEFTESTGVLTMTAIPEPATLALLSAGTVMMLYRRKRLK